MTSLTLERARGRKLLLWVILASLPIGAALLALEYVSYWSLPRWTLPRGVKISAFDSEMGFVSLPDMHEEWGIEPSRYHIFSDRRGARVTIPGEQAPENPEIIAIGCSFTWGAAVENQDTFVARLANDLKVPVLNLGLYAYGTTQSLQALRRRSELRPKLVIYSFISVHLVRNVSPCGPSFYPFCLDIPHVAKVRDGHLAIVPPASDGVARTELQRQREVASLSPATWLAHSTDVVLARMRWLASQRRDHAEQDAALAFLLEQMEQTVRDMGARILVVHIPMGNYASPPKALMKSVEQLHLPFLDLTQTFRDNQTLSLFIPNDGHPSSIGHRLIADAIVSFLRR